MKDIEELSQLIYIYYSQDPPSQGMRLSGGIGINRKNLGKSNSVGKFPTGERTPYGIAPPPSTIDDM